MDRFNIENVKTFTQRDNVIDPSVSCFPTSVGMCADYCLTSIGKTKADIGCAPNMQIEDYFNQVISSKEVNDWMKANTSKLGSWIWNFKPRTIFYVENYVFNMLMNPLGFKSVVSVDGDYDAFCSFISANKLPCVISGNFSSVSKVQGHMTCAHGFNKIGMKEIIVNDPWGDALTGYKSTDGANKSYGLKFFLKDKNKLNVLLISKI